MRVLKSLLLCIPLLSSCQQDEPRGSLPNARVSEQQYATALQVLSNSVLMRDGIPFEYADDGCFARALLMGALLAANGIPSSSHFVFAKAPPEEFEGDLRRDTRFYLRQPFREPIRWTYHVAPMLKAPGEPAMIIDPSLIRGEAQPLTAARWREMFMLPADPARGVLGTKLCRTVTVPSSVYLFNTDDAHECTNDTETTRMVSSLSEMPRFQLQDISDACTLLYTILESDLLRMSREERSARQRNLAEETARTVERIEEQRMLARAGAQFRCVLDRELLEYF